MDDKTALQHVGMVVGVLVGVACALIAVAVIVGH